ncbi:M36 family metallopeptidase [Streptomyces sp. NRRL S-87]|uniref:M36 family metallopeptidase n=1 Tax=Streptomyces sp. NRRL S-87 TaxID=1463920 RepID=UPI0004C27ABB|nr:M36 family metallopeptidase [Streptomyces sp. NRRL S-87]
MTSRRFRTRFLTAATTAAILLALAPAPAAAPHPEGSVGPFVRKDPASGHARMVYDPQGWLTGPSRMPAERIVLQYVRDHRTEFGLSEEQAGQLVVAASYLTKHNGAHQVTIGQVVDGMRVHGGLLTATVDSRGRLVLVGGRAATGAPAGSVELTAQDALDESAGAHGLRVRHVLPGADNRDKGKQRFRNRYAEQLHKPSDVTAELVWFPSRDGRTLRAAWLTDIEASGQAWYQTVVDAESGAILSRENLYRRSGPRGTVFTTQHPDAAGAARTVTPFTGRDGSWVADRLTQGNNVNAYRDEDNDNSADAARPRSPASGDPDFQHFDYAFGDTWRTNRSHTQANLDADLDAAVTQLFYYTNVMHDYLYGLGFDEAAGNFQADNFGRGGAQNDPVLAEAQDGWDDGCTDDATPPNTIRCLNNANFYTPPDGNSPRMQMYMWTAPRYAWRDGDFDGDVIAHEYGHGLSSRLVGGGTFGGGPQTDSLGEGWSDVVSFLKWGDAVVGEYDSGDATRGLRHAAYDRHPWTYATYDAAKDVHDNGEIWAATMYDVRKAKGIAYTQQLLVDGLKNTPSSPSFLDARDAVLAADRTNTGGADQCLLWRVFAARGMGQGATSSSDQMTVTTSTTVPAECLPTARAGGPYTTAEGTDVQLDGSASTKGTAASAGALVSYAWDLDGDGDHDDATGLRPTFRAVGQDGVFPIGLKVTDAAGNTDTDTSSVTVTNVAPAVSLDPVAGGPENTEVTLTGKTTDPGWLDPLSVTVDWGDGNGPQSVSGTEEHVRPDGTLTFSQPHTYGDDGTFRIEVCGGDDDTTTCASTSVVTGNVRPTAVIAPDGRTTYNGRRAYVAHAGVPVAVKGSSTDPGSDDLTLTWAWGDGTSDSLLSLVNPPAADPPLSPSVQPRNVTATRSHAYGRACLSTLTFTGRDDDGGTASDTAAVITTGNTKQAHDQAYWMNQFGGRAVIGRLPAAQLDCLLSVVSFMSSVYGPLTRAEAYGILSNGSPDPRRTTSTQLLAAWLNFANGSYDLSTPVDTDGNWIKDSTFGAAVADAEAVYRNAASTALQLDRRTKMLLAFNVRDGG